MRPLLRQLSSADAVCVSVLQEVWFVWVHLALSESQLTDLSVLPSDSSCCAGLMLINGVLRLPVLR